MWGGWLVALACVAGLGCGRGDGDPAAGIVVAHVDGEPVRVVPTATRDEQDRRVRLDQAIARTLAAREARRRGFTLRPGEPAPRLDAIAEEEELRDRLLLDERERVSVSEDELREHYARTQARYTERRLRLRRWTFETHASALRGAEGAGGGEGELLEPVALQRLPADLVPYAGRLMAGERVVAAAAGGFAVFEVAEVLPAAVRPLSEVHAEVEASWRALRGHESFRALMGRLRSEARVEIREGALSDGAIWDPAAGAPEG